MKQLMKWSQSLDGHLVLDSICQASQQGTTKFWILADALNHYCYYAMPYLGDNGDKAAVYLGVTVVKKLVKLLHNSGRNIACDQNCKEV